MCNRVFSAYRCDGSDKLGKNIGQNIAGVA